jgi:hypothetical protein
LEKKIEKRWKEIKTIGECHPCLPPFSIVSSALFNLNLLLLSASSKGRQRRRLLLHTSSSCLSSLQATVYYSVWRRRLTTKIISSQPAAAEGLLQLLQGVGVGKAVGVAVALAVVLAHKGAHEVYGHGKDYGGILLRRDGAQSLKKIIKITSVNGLIGGNESLLWLLEIFSLKVSSITPLSLCDNPFYLTERGRREETLQ